VYPNLRVHVMGVVQEDLQMFQNELRSFYFEIVLNNFKFICRM
jgi:hypothetical protein